MSSVTQIFQALHAVFAGADDLAHQTGFVQRERQGKITGKRFALTQVFGLLQRGEVSMSDLSSFARHTGMRLTKQSLHAHGSRLVARLAQRRLYASGGADPVALPLLRRFREVIVEDSSTFTLPGGCREAWHGCGGSGTKGPQSAFKIQVRWDLLRGGFKGMALQDGRTPDNRSPLKGVRRGTKSVRVGDLGDFDTAEFAEEEEAGEYFVSRYKGSVKLYEEAGNELDVLSLLREKANGQEYECRVQVSAARGVPARLIAVPVPEEVAIKRQAGHRRTAQKHGRHPSEQMLDLCQWTLVLTNIPQEDLSVQEALMRLR